MKRIKETTLICVNCENKVVIKSETDINICCTKFGLFVPNLGSKSCKFFEREMETMHVPNHPDIDSTERDGYPTFYAGNKNSVKCERCDVDISDDEQFEDGQEIVCLGCLMERHLI